MERWRGGGRRGVRQIGGHGGGMALCIWSLLSDDEAAKATQGQAESEERTSALNKKKKNPPIQKSNPIKSRFLIKSPLYTPLVSQQRRHFFSHHISFFPWHNSFPHLWRNEKLSLWARLNGLFHSYQPPASLWFLGCESSPLFCSGGKRRERVAAAAAGWRRGVPRSSVPPPPSTASTSLPWGWTPAAGPVARWGPFNHTGL